VLSWLIITIINFSRPKSKYADWEEPAQEGEPFDYDAVPTRFYFEVESSGCLAPDEIVQEGIKALQQKLATLIQDLSEKDGVSGMNGDDYAPQSPNGMNGGGWQDNGYTTPYADASGGQTSAWGAGAATPYGSSATPYGNAGGSWP
jgi:DNA-directed RNA polymerase II subunit RPB3